MVGAEAKLRWRKDVIGDNIWGNALKYESHKFFKGAVEGL